MSDTTTVWDTANCRGDWVLVDAQLQTGNDLATSVQISLFTDRVADPADVIPDGTTNPRGWCGDLGEDYPIGSRLWLLDRSKQTPQVLAAATTYVNEALQWLLDDGVVDHFDNTIEWVSAGMLGIWIIAFEYGGRVSTMQYQWAWKGLT